MVEWMVDSLWKIWKLSTKKVGFPQQSVDKSWILVLCYYNNRLFPQPQQFFQNKKHIFVHFSTTENKGDIPNFSCYHKDISFYYALSIAELCQFLPNSSVFFLIGKEKTGGKQSYKKDQDQCSLNSSKNMERRL